MIDLHGFLLSKYKCSIIFVKIISKSGRFPVPYCTEDPEIRVLNFAVDWENPELIPHPDMVLTTIVLKIRTKVSLWEHKGVIDWSFFQFIQQVIKVVILQREKIDLKRNILLLSARTAMWSTPVILTGWENDRDS